MATIDNSVFRSSFASNLSAGSYSVTLTNDGLPGCIAIDTFTIFEPPNLFLVFDKQDISSCTIDDGAITAFPVGGVGGNLVNWINPTGVSLGNSASITNLSAGIYTATLRDANNCIAIDSVEINNPSPPEIQFLEDVALNCASDKADLQVIAVPGRPSVTIANYDWSHNPNINGSSAFNISPGTIIVTVVDSDNCSTIDTAVVSAPPTLQINATTPVSPCFGDANGQLAINVSGGTPFANEQLYSITWDDGIMGSTLPNIEAGNYNVSIRDANNCALDTALTLVNRPNIALTFDIANVTGVSCFDTVSPADCDGSAGASAIYDDGSTGAFTFTWGATGEIQSNTTAFSYTSLCAGVQYLSVTDGQCEVIDSIVIPSPDRLEAIETIVLPSCGGSLDGSISIATTGGTPPYDYNFGNGFTSNNSINNLSSGNYNIIIRDANNCTSSIDNVQLNEGAITAEVEILQNILCFGENNGSIQINTTNTTQPLQFNFNDGNGLVGNEALAGLQAGNYVVDIIDANGCQANTSFSLVEPNPLNLVLAPSSLSCAGANDGTIIPNVTGGIGDYNYTWSNGASTSMLDYLSAGFYSVTVMDANNCCLLYTSPSPRDS